MQKLITLSILAGLSIATPAIVFIQKPAVAQTYSTQYQGLDFYTSEFAIVTSNTNTARINFNIRNRTSGRRTLTGSEAYDIQRIRMVDGRTGKSYSVSDIEGDTSEILEYGGDTLKLKMTFELPQGIWPTHLELDTDTDQPLKIRL
jgi:hypothetical protein